MPILIAVKFRLGLEEVVLIFASHIPTWLVSGIINLHGASSLHAWMTRCHAPVSVYTYTHHLSGAALRAKSLVLLESFFDYFIRYAFR